MTRLQALRARYRRSTPAGRLTAAVRRYSHLPGEPGYQDPHEAAFHKAIAENPAERTHWAAYADWLDDRGERPGFAALLRAMADHAPGLGVHADHGVSMSGVGTQTSESVNNLANTNYIGDPHARVTYYKNALHGPKDFFRFSGVFPKNVAAALIRGFHAGGERIVGASPEAARYVEQMRPKAEEPAQLSRAVRRYAMRGEDIRAGAQRVQDGIQEAIRHRMNTPEEAAGYADSNFAANVLADELDNQGDPRHVIVRGYADRLKNPYENSSLSHSIEAAVGEYPGLAAAVTGWMGRRESDTPVELGDGTYLHMHVHRSRDGRHAVSFHWNVPVGTRFGEKDMDFDHALPEEEAVPLAHAIHPEAGRRLEAGLAAVRNRGDVPQRPTNWDREVTRFARPVARYAAYRAPAGGAVAHGTYYKGGKLMPDLSKFDPVKMSALKATWKERARKVKAVSGGSTNREDYSGGNGAGGIVVSYAQATPVTWHDKDGVLHTGEVTGAGDSGGTVTVTESGPSGKPGGKKRTLDLFDKYTAPAFSEPGDKVSQFARAAAKVARYARNPGVHDEFIKRINRQPMEATHRAVYADWLEDNDPDSVAPETNEGVNTLEFLRTHQGPAWAAVGPDGKVAAGKKWTIQEIRQAMADAGSHWFDPGSMRFFGTRLHGQPFHGPGGVTFVTSEQLPHGPRGFTVRMFQPPYSNFSPRIGTFELTGHPDLASARAVAQRIASGGRVDRANPEHMRGNFGNDATPTPPAE